MSTINVVKNVIGESNTNYWHVRDLMTQLGCTEWRNFTGVIEKAITSCRHNAGIEAGNHFVEVNKMVDLGSRATSN
jgi:DNA-damage-inducible protein D